VAGAFAHYNASSSELQKASRGSADQNWIRVHGLRQIFDEIRFEKNALAANINWKEPQSSEQRHFEFL
jgi:hypothetical protein